MGKMLQGLFAAIASGFHDSELSTIGTTDGGEEMIVLANNAKTPVYDGRGSDRPAFFVLRLHITYYVA